MALRCGQARRIALGAVGGHASEAERLELEAHLATCAGCSAEHQTLGLIRRLRATEPEGLTPAARDRVRSALVARPASPASPARRLIWPMGAGIAVAMAAGVVLLALAGGRPGRPERIVAGDVTAGAAPAGGDKDAVTYRSARGGRVLLGDATTDLAPATEIVWRRRSRTVELQRGGLTVDVPHRPGQRFQVLTGRFTVDVVGTRFDVDSGGVRTERGTVRILDSNGRTLATVAAGESWSPTPIPIPTPGPTAIPSPATLREAPGLNPPAAALPESRAAVLTPAERLARARHALARGDAQEARRMVEPVFHLGRDVAVEARAVYAESFLIEGRYTDAIDGYRVVVRDFDGTAQAESALYAVAQLESEHGRPEEARAALQRYLTRYPRGRFAHEASARLARLAP